MKLPRDTLMAYEMLARMPLDVGLDRHALDASQRGLALADGAGIVFWRGRSDATQRRRASAFAARIGESARECERLMAMGA